MKLIIKKKPVKSTYSYDPCRDGVSQSMLGAWLECREKSRINLLLGWSSGGVSKPFTFGTLSHGVLDHYYNGIRLGKIKKLDDALHAFPAWMKLSEAAWRKENPRANTAAKDLLEECISIAQEVLPRYMQQWHVEDTSVRWTHVETEFKVPLTMKDGKVVHMRGKVDGAFVNKRNHLLLFETKNKSQWSERIGEYLPLDLQLGYYLTGLAATTGDDPWGVRYNLIRRPGERRGKTENLKAFCQRIGENIGKKPDHYYQRLEVQLTTQEKDEQKFRAQKLVEEFYAWFKTTDKTKRDLMWNSGACENKYGTCGNLSICANQDFSNHRIRDVVSPELAAE